MASAARGARRQRKVAEPRRSERQIERRPPRSAAPTSATTADGAAQAEVRPRRQVAFAIHGGQQAAADFDPRCLGFGHPDQPGGEIPIDLGELILVDGCLVAAGCGAAPRLNGQSTANTAATVISANTNHSVIKQFPGGTSAF